MSENEYDELVRKMQQHEATIAQLLEMVAAVNRRLSEMEKKQEEPLHTYS
ncbi:hypothetical protein SAMN04488072_10364 [Lentibacillus halodurans]|uniref:Uncharacterized protein n=1 Tax=Lentibacillus halodurans TaxID=237679 RepID=A0A1I0WIH3_9BACI|nr:hypothetical protein [Lentibacillus halodurans]SFA88421.1 hypothetical protein SAMN04488072_10364 [Lentibacillus halodurans]